MHRLLDVLPVFDGDTRVTMRLVRSVTHGCGGPAQVLQGIAALLADTPATVLCCDSRTLELCRYFEIPHRMLAKVRGDLDPADRHEADFGPLMRGHQERFDRFMNFLDKNGRENTFIHGDGGAAYETRMSELAFPSGIHPWNGTDAPEMGARLNWLQSQLTTLTAQNAQFAEVRCASFCRAFVLNLPHGLKAWEGPSTGLILKPVRHGGHRQSLPALEDRTAA
ncbi:hypothetical protein AB0D13_03105 [Streptomyces sp. NPDC048430]|uniref:hypothetical protein n=1 Tax=Streptomyces sp. NPDC048430 TaxID=3155388 RepID=UPI00343CEA51